MVKRLMPYGLADCGNCIAKVGKSKAVARLVARMPTAELAAKVGSANGVKAYDSATRCRVLRKNAQAARPD